MDTKELKVEGMTCGGCEESITRALLRIPGVLSVRADHKSGTVIVDGEDLEAGKLSGAVEDAGYTVRA